MENIHCIRSAEEALKVLRGAARVFVHCRIDGLIGENEMAYIPDYWTGGLRVTPQHARAFVKDVFDGKPVRVDRPYLKMSVRMDTPYPTWDRKKGGHVQGRDQKIVWIG